MKQGRYFIAVRGVVICLIILISSCSNKDKEGTTASTESEEITTTAKLVLKLTPGQSSTYRLKTTTQRKIALVGSLPENAINFPGGQTTHKLEIVFDQHIQSINTKGSAITKITIKELKFFSEEKDETLLDYDSSSETQKVPNNALSALIGQSYTIKLTPTGQVSGIIDTNDIRALISKNLPNSEIAIRLLDNDSIQRRHNIPAIPDANQNEPDIGATWNNVISFDFDEMGVQAYERIYTLDTIEDINDHQIAVVSMNAIPSIEGIRDREQSELTSFIAGMSDNQYTYTGRLKFDMTSGTLEQYNEQLESRWTVVPSRPGEKPPPNALSMTEIQSYDIEKIDE